MPQTIGTRGRCASSHVAEPAFRLFHGLTLRLASAGFQRLASGLGGTFRGVATSGRLGLGRPDCFFCGVEGGALR